MLMTGKTTVGMSVYTQVHPRTNACLVAWALCNAHLRPWHYKQEMSCYIHDNRERIVQAALRVESEWLIFIDSDMVFPSNGIETLISRGKDVIGAWYNTRNAEPIVPTVRMWDGGELAVPRTKPDAPFRCATVGTGFMCIRLESLKKMKPRYFRQDDEYGDDISFCLRAADAGLEVWCDPTIPMQHVGEKLY